MTPTVILAGFAALTHPEAPMVFVVGFALAALWLALDNLEGPE